MNLLQYRIALQSLKMNRPRTTLTTLGIIIGVASITLILSLGKGIENTMQSQVSNLGDNIMLVSSGTNLSYSEAIQRYNPYGLNVTTSLVEQDLNSIRLNENIDKVAPIMLLTGAASSPIGHKNAPILATTPEFADILGLSVKNSGQFIDSSTVRNVAVVGSSLATELFGSDQILGQQFTLKGRNHTVVGVLKPTDSPINISGIDLDHSIITSFENGKSFNQGVAQIQQIMATVKDPSKLPTVQKEVDELVYANHKEERDYTVLAGKDVATHGNSSFKAIFLMTAVVATITLIVGGIGIMNIMLVGVSERTREIGIRKALGAANSHILSQFLIEALIMCVVGGLIGLAIGYSIAFLIASKLMFEPAITWQTSSIGLGMAFVTGILFGVYPAIKAARKDPIDSLRQYH